MGQTGSSSDQSQSADANQAAPGGTAAKPAESGKASNSRSAKSADSGVTGGKPAIVAWVNTAPIYYHDVERTVATLTAGQKVDPSQLPTIEATVLEDMIEQSLLLKMLDSPEYKPTPEEVDKAIADLQAKLHDLKKTMKDYLDQTKLSEAALKNKMTYELAMEKYVDKNTTDEALENYFKQNHALFDGTRRRISHILLRPMSVGDEKAIQAMHYQADQLRGQIAVGQLTFEAAAEKYSAGPSRHNGGDLGYLTRDAIAAEPFAKEAFSLRLNEMSRPLFSSVGVHLIKVTDIKPGNKTWQEVKDRLKPAFTQYLMAKMMTDIVAGAKIEFSDSFPHFIPGTKQLAGPQTVGAK